MTILRRFMLPLLLVIVAFHFSFEDSEARRRIGGGRSFGSKPSMSRQKATPSQNQLNRQNTQQNSAGQQENRGFFGGMGGVFTGLLAGSLLGSLFSGGGFGGGFMGIILIGLLLFVGVKVFQSLSRSRRREEYRPATEVNTHRSPQQNSAWAMLENEEEKESVEKNNSFPVDFDEEEFVKGAKILFTRLQESWAKNDLEDIKKFTSTEVFSEIVRQADEDPEIGEIAVLHLNAQVLEVKDTVDERRILVFFTALIKESKEAESSNVNEYWHFVRSEATNSMWILDGIQQAT